MTKRIIFFNSYSIWGGGEKWHYNAAIYSRSKGIETYIISGKNGKLITKAKESNIPFLEISPNKRSYYSISFQLKLFLFFKSKKFDAIIFNSPVDVRMAAPIAKLAGIKKIVMRSGMPIAPKYNLSNKLAFRQLTHIFGNCETIKNTFLIDAPKLVSHLKFETIYNGVKIQEEVKHLKNDPLILGSLSRLTEQKGIDLLLYTAKKLKDRMIPFKLLIAGTGEDEDKLKELASNLELSPEVEFIGFVKDTSGFLQNIDILVFSSLWEGCSNTLIEAMAFEKAITCFNISTMPELITNEKTGLVCDAKNVEAFTESIIRLISDDNLRTKLGQNARVEAQQRFDYDKNFEQFFTLLS